jgi:hypothetical protein
MVERKIQHKVEKSDQFYRNYGRLRQTELDLITARVILQRNFRRNFKADCGVAEYVN